MLVKSGEEFASKSYDYLIIGGGTAGLVLASRLSEDASVSVGVLEAGKSHLDDPKTQCPGLALSMWNNEEYDWKLKTVPQEFLNGRVLDQARGKGLGGSSAINLMMCTFPSRQDINDWKALDSLGWSFDDLAIYYKKFEGSKNYIERANNFYHSNNTFDPTLHNGNGPIQTSYPKTERVGDREWLEAFEARGLKLTVDPKSGDNNGAYSNLHTIDPSTGFRSYSASAYYQPVSSRENLSVLTEAQVHRITFSAATGGQSPRATGILFGHQASDAAAQHKVIAKREVLLCAGVYHSPQILELSGIGSSSILKAHGINVIVDNPDVGENLQDHTIVPLCWEVETGVTTLDSLVMEPHMAEKAFAEFWAEKNGPLSAVCSSVANLSYPQIKRDEGQSIPKTVSNTPATNFRGRQEELLKNSLANSAVTAMQYLLIPVGSRDQSGSPGPLTSQHLSIYSTLARPLSHGSVHIASRDISTPPAIDPRYFSHPLDMQLTIDAVLWAQEFATTQEPFSSLLKGPNGEKIRKDGKPALKTRDEVAAWVRDTAITKFHPLGTCAIGVRGDGGVVDERLRVYGVQGLRVIDASVAPMMVRNNVQSMVYAIAERAADIIKQDNAAS